MVVRCAGAGGAGTALPRRPDTLRPRSPHFFRLGRSLLWDVVLATPPCPLVSATCLRILESQPLSQPSYISLTPGQSPTPRPLPVCLGVGSLPQFQRSLRGTNAGKPLNLSASVAVCLPVALQRAALLSILHPSGPCEAASVCCAQVLVQGLAREHGGHRVFQVSALRPPPSGHPLVGRQCQGARLAFLHCCQALSCALHEGHRWASQSAVPSHCELSCFGAPTGSGYPLVS